MKERPILMSAPMIRATLADLKWQTRRIVTPERPGAAGVEPMDIQLQLRNWLLRAAARCRQGQAGDHLWVKETWATEKAHDAYAPSMLPKTARLHFMADGPKPEWAGKTRVSIHMPRWVSRINLEVTGVRVERLNAISEADAKAEGCEQIGITFQNDAEGRPHMVPSLGGPYRDGFRILWESIHGAGAWAANPWVWSISFKRVTP